MEKLLKKLIAGEPCTIGFLGDSITQGCFGIYKNSINELASYCLFGEVYHQRLKEIFSMLYPDSPVNILNYGKSGDTLKKGLQRLPDLIAHTPDVYVICFGLNDSGAGIGGLADFRRNLIVLLEMVNTASVVFMTPNMLATRVADRLQEEFIPIAEDNIRRQNNGCMDKYIDVIRQVCEERQVAVCDCYRIWKRLEKRGVDTTMLLANGINHPVPQMHWIFAYELVRLLLDM